MKLAWMVVVSSLVLAACGSTTQEDAEAVPEPTATDAGAPSPVEEGTFADVNDTRLFYEVQGEGPWLILISGANLDSRLWEEQVRNFADRFRVLRYDPRGVGRSDLPEGPFSHYEDLHALFDSLNIESAHLIGFSFGAGVALDFAVAYPQSVDSLILVAPGLSSWKDDLTPVLSSLSELAMGGQRAQAIEMLLGDPSMPSAERSEAREKMRAMLEDSPSLFDSDFAYLRLMEPLDPPAEERLEAIVAPTLLIVGERDHPGIHENVDALQEGIVGARKALIMGVGHVVNLEHPEELERIVLDFLAGD